MRDYTIAKHKPLTTWILVADSKCAQVYVRGTGEKRIPLGGNAKHHHYDESFVQELTLVPGMTFKAEARDDYEIGRKQRGSVFESRSSACHANEPRVDVDREIVEHFMKSVVQHLRKVRAKKAFDRLVLVAPPRILGEFKRHAGKDLLGRITAELPKDLVRFESGDLAEHLKKIV